MKRILYIHHAGGIGGAPVGLLYVLQQIDRTRIEPIILSLEDGPMVDVFREAGIETHVAQGVATAFSHTYVEWYGGRNLWRLPVQAAAFLPTVQTIRRHIRAVDPDLIHLNSSTLASGAIAGKLENRPVVWHTKEPLHTGYFGLRRAFIQWVARRYADHIVAICRNDAEHMMPQGGENVHVIYDTVRFEEFDRALSGDAVRQEFGIGPQQPVISMLGGVSEPKGTINLIRALPEMDARIPNMRVLIAGPAPKPLDEKGFKGMAKKLLNVDAYQKQVMAALERLPMRDKVTFTGIRLDMPALIAASDVVLFPSAVQHFARPLLEAAAMAKPGIASDLGGPDEIIVHGETGLLVPPNDPAALAAAVAEVVLDKQKARRMGEAGYQRALRLFQAEKAAQEIVHVYDEIWNEASP